MKARLNPSTTSMTPYTGTWGFAQAAHLLRRTMFGATAADIATIQAMTMSQAVEMLLTDVAETSLPLIWYHGDDNGTQENQPWNTLPYDATNDFNRSQSLGAWWIGLMISQNISIREKMTLFWHNHFACGAVAVGDARYSYTQCALLRANALGNFKSLVKSITFDPAMLRYLSGNLNVSAAPNENYGRELQELFTIGKGAEVSTGDYTTYTEADVKAAARVLTGWTDNPTTIGYVFNAANHDSTDKQFSNRYNNTIIKGRTDQAGAEAEIDDLLTMIFSETATAQYICRKLYRWFVDYMVDDNIEQNVITPLAQCLITNNFEIKPVLSLLFQSSMFYDPGIIGCIIKNPLDLIVGAVRTLNIVMPNSNPDVLLTYYGWIAFMLSGTDFGMSLLEPPNVAGWPEYYEAPAYHEMWINSSTLDSRIKFLLDISQGKYPIAVQTYYINSIDPTVLAAESSDPSTPTTLLSDWVNLLFANPLTSDQMTTLHDTLLPGLPDYEWTNDWNAYIANPKDATKKQTVNNKLSQLLTYMVQMAEYQLM